MRAHANAVWKRAMSEPEWHLNEVKIPWDEIRKNAKTMVLNVMKTVI